MTDDTETTQNLTLEQAGKQTGNKKFRVVTHAIVEDQTSSHDKQARLQSTELVVA